MKDNNLINHIEEIAEEVDKENREEALNKIDVLEYEDTNIDKEVENLKRVIKEEDPVKWQFELICVIQKIDENHNKKEKRDFPEKFI